MGIRNGPQITRIPNLPWGNQLPRMLCIGGILQKLLYDVLNAVSFLEEQERINKRSFFLSAISYYLPCFPWVKFHGPSWIIHERYFLGREGCTAPAPRGSTSHLLFISFLTKGNPSLIPPIEKCDLFESYFLNPRNEINGSHHGRTSSITSRDVNHEIFLL